MTPGDFATLTIPPFADAGSITLTAGSGIAVGNATTAANLRVGDYFVMTSLPFQYRCLSTPDASFNFMINATAPDTVTKQAWSITQPCDQSSLDLIYSHNDAGNTAGRAAHDAAADGYVYLDTQATRIWERNGPAGTWTDATITVVLWVSPTGSDADDVSDQLLTVQAAVDRLTEAGDLTGWTVIIALKPGTYNQTVNLKEIDGAPALLAIMGEASLTGVRSAASYTISSSVTDAIRATGIKSVWTLDGFTLVSTKGHCMQAKNARLRFNQLRFGACAGSHISAMGGSTIILAGDGYSIANGANAHINSNGSGAVVDLQAESTARPTITLPATNISFKSAYAWARASGQIFTGTGLTFTNKNKVVNTRRWRAEQNSSIDSGQSGEKYLPGDAAGIAVKSGEYL
jgi:hypothetical protein